MSIFYNIEKQCFHLMTENSSYIIGLVDNYLIHAYWGKKLNEEPELNLMMPYIWRHGMTFVDREVNPMSSECLPMEYPTYGRTDTRTPAFHMVDSEGSTTSEFKYKNYQIYKGKKEICGLPASYGCSDEVTSLEIVMIDEVEGLELTLSYSVFESKNVITRHSVIKNIGNKEISIEKILSSSVDFYGKDFDIITLKGAWGKERHVQRNPLQYGFMTIDSKRGASSHQFNPFVAIAEKDATEKSGNVYAMSLIYSGNFVAGADVEQYSMTRMYIGINPFNFSWLLEPGEEFVTPEAVMVYASDGIGEMSRIFHNFYHQNLCRKELVDKERPILINNWEATYFDFNEEKLLQIAQVAKDIGIEMFVLDDGWFGERNDDTSSLGDWYANAVKLPNGISGLANKIDKMGMKFGLWVEPEMCSPDSKLFREHPDWIISAKGRTVSLSRNQYILDLSNKDVCDYIITAISSILKDSKISYVKWDMNRNMNEIGSKFLPANRQRELPHRYILGLYYILETLTNNFKNVLFEGSAGGGGRFDPGMLYYMPQIWTSDCTDAVERLYIQYGTSIAYPVSTMGAHISAVPNHQVGRITPLSMRADVAMIGQFGLELDLRTLKQEEIECLKSAIQYYKQIRRTIHFGDMYRLASPFDGNFVAFEFVSKDRSEVVVCTYSILTNANPEHIFVKLEGIDAENVYYDETHGLKMSGNTLMNLGFSVINQKDFCSEIYVFRSNDKKE
jgi:alpha-galactosidase